MDGVTGQAGTADDSDLWVDGRLDANGFAVLFDRHVQSVYRFCARRCGDLDLAEDLTSQTFLEAWRIRGRVVPSESMLPWLFGVATNVVRNSARAGRRYRTAMARIEPATDIADHGDAVVNRAAASAALVAAAAALNTLPERDRDVVALVVWEGLSYQQAAVDIPVGTVRSRLNRGRSRLAAALTDVRKELP